MTDEKPVVLSGISFGDVVDEVIDVNNDPSLTWDEEGKITTIEYDEGTEEGEQSTETSIIEDEQKSVAEEVPIIDQPTETGAEIQTGQTSSEILHDNPIITSGETKLED